MKKTLLLSILIISFVIPNVAIGQNKKVEKANEYFQSGEYFDAYEQYVKLFPKLKDRVEKGEVSYRAGVCAMYMQKPQNSITWFRRATLYKYQNPLVNLYLADSYMQKSLYEEALKYYTKYKELSPGDIRGENGILSCQLANEWIETPSRFEVKMVNTINSNDNDFAPSFAGRDTSTLYFTSTRPSANGTDINSNSGVNFADIYVAKKDKKGIWSQPIPAPGELNTEYDDGSGTISKDGRMMYYTYCAMVDDVDMGCKIYTSQLSGSAWGKPSILEISKQITQDTSMSVGQPAVSNDELTLYFISDSDKGIGGKDIWVCTRKSKNSKWSLPKNLGDQINTKYDELFPSVDTKGNLYFSSNGRVGMGGFDIYKATKNKNGKWTVENMKYPINSSANDYGIIFNPYTQSGYFSSNRNLRKGDDIYSFSQKPLDITLKGFVINEKNHAYITEVNIEITGSDGSKITVKSDNKGSFTAKLRENVDYAIITDKVSFLKTTGSVSTKGVEEDGKVFETELYLTPGIGNIKIKNIRYDFNDTTLREESKVALDNLIEILEVNSTIIIELMAHTDFRGSEPSNLTLSQGRANSVVKYLIDNGIDKKRLVAKGYGESKPFVVDAVTAKINPFLESGTILDEKYITSLKTENEKEICHELNRRTEFRVLRNDYGQNYEKFGTN